jgi:hypothetical protein
MSSVPESTVQHQCLFCGHTDPRDLRQLAIIAGSCRRPIWVCRQRHACRFAAAAGGRV